MHLVRIAITSVIALSAVALSVSCSKSNDSDDETFATYQDCYNEHHETEGFDSSCAIEICCIDHPIGNAAMNVVCGSDSDTCETYVTANLTDGSDANLGSDIISACSNYTYDSGRGSSGPGGQCGS